MVKTIFCASSCLNTLFFFQMIVKIVETLVTILEQFRQAGIYLFKVKMKTPEYLKMCSNLTIKTPE